MDGPPGPDRHAPFFEIHTSKHFPEAPREAVTEWNLQRGTSIIPVTTDNAKNTVNAVNATAGLGPQIGCFAHIVNLAVKNAVSKCTTTTHTLKTKQEMLKLPVHKLIHDNI